MNYMKDMTCDELFIFFEKRLQEIYANPGKVDRSTVKINKTLKDIFDSKDVHNKWESHKGRRATTLKGSSQIDLEEYILQLPEYWNTKQ